MARSTQFRLGRPLSTIICRFMIYEKAPGDGDRAVARVIGDMSDAYPAERVSSRRYTSGLMAQAQLIEDTRGSLAGMENPDDAEALFAFMTGVKGRKMFQGSGLLYNLIKTAPVAQPEIHDIPDCGLPVVYVPIPRTPDALSAEKKTPPYTPPPAKQARRPAPRRDS